MLNSLFTKSFNNSFSPLSFADLDSLKPTNEDDLEGILCHVQEIQHILIHESPMVVMEYLLDC